MKNFTKVIQYILPYKYYAFSNLLFNLIAVIASLFSLTMAIPFLGILFGAQELVETPPELEFSVESISGNFSHVLSRIIRNYGSDVALGLISILIVIMTFFKTFFHYLSLYVLAPIRNGIVKDIRNKVYNKILNLQLSYFSEERKGDIIARITNDVQEIEWSILSSFQVLSRVPITMTIYLISLFIISVKLTLFAIVLLPISGYIIGIVGRNLRKVSLKGQEKMGGLLSYIEETLSGLRIIKAFNAEESIYNRFEKENDLYTRIMVKMFQRRYLASPMSELLGTMAIVIVMWFGGSIVLRETGELNSQVFIGYLIIFSQIINPAKSFSTAYYNIQKGMASIDRINIILNAEENILEIPNAKSKNDFTESIEYRNVSFKYQKEEVLKNINLKVEKGKTVALVGQSGSGKSTLVDLLPRFYDVVGGDILIDGISIKKLKLIDLRDLMGIVNQESILFNDTLFNNIAFGSKNVAKEEVEAAAKVGNAHDFIMNTEKAYQTNIGDRGGKLSGGQRQRISIARAVLKNPPILILDEATSSLDTESERLVQLALYNLMKSRTSIVIAHRLSTVRDADEICVLHEGEIVERGTHDELMSIAGQYKKLHDLQMFS